MIGNNHRGATAHTIITGSKKISEPRSSPNAKKKTKAVAGTIFIFILYGQEYWPSQ